MSLANIADDSENYVVDTKGNRVAIVLNMENYRQLREAQEELASIQAYDAAKASKDAAIPFDQALKEIKQRQK